MKRALVRCDGTPEGGMGHLVRALSVAQSARSEGWQVTFAGSVTSPFAHELVQTAGIDVVPPSADLRTLAASCGADLVHVDHYETGWDARDQVRAAGAVLCSMEDGFFGRRPADVVVDSAIGAEQPGSLSMTRPDDGSGVVLRGIAYAPMRPEVLDARADRAARPGRPAARAMLGALVVMGGSDAAGASAIVAAVCRMVAGIGHVTVIAPRARWAAVRAQAGSDIELVEPGAGFLVRAAAADLVVSTASTTTWELACIGVPTVVVVAVENQQHVYDAALAHGIARGLGTLDDVRADPDAAALRLQDCAADLQAGRSWAGTGTKLVDGLGAARIVRAWDDLVSVHGPRG